MDEFPVALYGSSGWVEPVPPFLLTILFAIKVKSPLMLFWYLKVLPFGYVLVNEVYSWENPAYDRKKIQASKKNWVALIFIWSVGLVSVLFVNDNFRE